MIVPIIDPNCSVASSLKRNKNMKINKLNIPTIIRNKQLNRILSHVNDLPFDVYQMIMYKLVCKIFYKKRLQYYFDIWKNKRNKLSKIASKREIRYYYKKKLEAIYKFSNEGFNIEYIKQDYLFKEIFYECSYPYYDRPMPKIKKNNDKFRNKKNRKMLRSGR